MNTQPRHRFELLAAEEIKELSENVFRVGRIRVSGPAIDGGVQFVPVDLTRPDEHWMQWRPLALDIDFDGYLPKGSGSFPVRTRPPAASAQDPP